MHNLRAARVYLPFRGYDALPNDLPSVKAILQEQLTAAFPEDRCRVEPTIDEPTMQRRATQNLVASVVSAEFQVKLVREALLGIDEGREKDSPLRHRPNAIFGI